MGTNKLMQVIMIAIVAVAWSGCGGTAASPSYVQGTVQPANTITGFVTDASADSVMAFRADIISAVLLDSSGHAVRAAGLTRRIEVGHLELAPGILFQAVRPIVPATYTTLKITMANPEIEIGLQGGGVQKLTNFSLPAVLPLNPVQVSVPLGGVFTDPLTAGLMLDFDLADSLTTDTAGNYVFRPVIKVQAVPDTQTAWVLGAARGKIVAMSQSPAWIDLQLMEGGFTVRLAVDNSTDFAPSLKGISSLSVGQMIETYAQFRNGVYSAMFIDSAFDPSVSKRGVVVVPPTVDGSPLQILVQN